MTAKDELMSTDDFGGGSPTEFIERPEDERVILIELTEEQLDNLTKVAEQAGVTVEEWVIGHATATAEQIIAAQRRTTPSGPASVSAAGGAGGRTTFSPPPGTPARPLRRSAVMPKPTAEELAAAKKQLDKMRRKKENRKFFGLK